MTGHLFGAAGGIEAIITLKSIMGALFHQPSIMKTPDPECDLNYVPNEALHQDVNFALSNGFGFGGHNAVLAFKNLRNKALA